MRLAGFRSTNAVAKLIKKLTLREVFGTFGPGKKAF